MTSQFKMQPRYIGIRLHTTFSPRSTKCHRRFDKDSRFPNLSEEAGAPTLSRRSAILKQRDVPLTPNLHLKLSHVNLIGGHVTVYWSHPGSLFFRRRQ